MFCFLIKVEAVECCESLAFPFKIHLVPLSSFDLNHFTVEGDMYYGRICLSQLKSIYRNGINFYMALIFIQSTKYY